MDFALSDHQRMVQQRAREFAAAVLDPVASELDRKGSCPPEIINGIAEVGLLGCEDDFVAYVAGLVEISKSWASLGAIIAVHNSLVCYPIARFGDEAQKKRRYKEVLDGCCELINRRGLIGHAPPRQPLSTRRARASSRDVLADPTRLTSWT